MARAANFCLGVFLALTNTPPAVLSAYSNKRQPCAIKYWERSPLPTTCSQRTTFGLELREKESRPNPSPAPTTFNCEVCDKLFLRHFNRT